MKTKRRNMRALAALIAVACCVTIAVLISGARNHGHTAVAAGSNGSVTSVAPDFSGYLARKAKIDFDLNLLRGHPVLITFLDTQAKAGASRSQIVFVKSMETQNSAYGLRVVLVDAASIAGVAPPSRDNLVNYGFDQALPSSIDLLGDPDGSIAKDYEVHTVPTTFLLDRHGVIVARWDGFAGAAKLDFAIRPVVGRQPPGTGIG